jgi:hypothetical protein
MKQGLLFVVLSIAAYAAQPLGEAIKLKAGPSGKPAFGVTYSLGAQDPDGNNLMLTLSKAGDAFPKGTVWNIYRRDTGAFVLPSWAVSDVAFSTWQTKIDDKGPVRNLLPFQKQLVVVFETPAGTRFHFDLGALCGKKEFEGAFKNLTSNKRCDEVTAEDLGPEPARHGKGSSTH